MVGCLRRMSRHSSDNDLRGEPLYTRPAWSTKEKPSVLPRVFCYQPGRKNQRDFPRIPTMYLRSPVLRFGALRLVTGQDRCQNDLILRFSRPENGPG